tara:strand:- start:7204 stop:7401 length:198 start_codon:yes stop_codon:yes gene_type:complete
MAHYFKILINGRAKVYQNFEEIPESFENVIAFVPEVPEPPHTDEQHEEMEQWEGKLQELMERETM